jgi:hypothetical protein
MMIVRKKKVQMLVIRFCHMVMKTMKTNGEKTNLGLNPNT